MIKIKVVNYLVNILDFFNIPGIIKNQKKLKTLKQHNTFIVSQLKSKGFKNIKKCSISTWKSYDVDRLRMTYSAYDVGKKRVLIKCTKGFEQKTHNSIRFQCIFNDLIDFIPKGYTINMDGYLCQVTQFIDSYPFTYAKYLINKNNVSFYVEQINHILDVFNDYNLIHCDINAVNILIDKKSKKLFLIDFDTCCSPKYELECSDFPRSKYYVLSNDSVVFDDAKAFVELLKETNLFDLIEKKQANELLSKIGRNTIAIHKKYCNYND